MYQLSGSGSVKTKGEEIEALGEDVNKDSAWEEGLLAVARERCYEACSLLVLAEDDRRLLALLVLLLLMLLI